MTRNYLKSIFVFLTFLITQTLGFSQSILISHTLPDKLYVCGEDQFSITIYNTSATAMTGANLRIVLPAGLLYVSGSISGGATEQNISDLAQPIFSLPVFAAASNKEFSVSVRATCDAADVLDAGGLFKPEFIVTAGANVGHIVATPFSVETGLMVVQSVDFPVLTGERLDTLFRKICIKNTRLGAIGNLSVEDQHAPGIETSFQGAINQNNNLTLGTANYNGGLFSQFGDGDLLLEFNEVACFTERVVVTDCGVPEISVGSLLRVGWGCDGTLCRYDSIALSVDVKESKLVPDLTFKSLWKPPVNHCAQAPAQAGLIIHNQGLGPAQNVLISIDVPVPEYAGMDSSSFKLVQGNTSTPLALGLSFDNTLFQCSRKVLLKANLSVPFIASGETVQVLFDYYNCESACSDELPGFYINYFYTKPCPVNGFISDTTFIEPDYDYTFDAHLNMNLGECVQEGDVVSMDLCVLSKRLIESAGYLNLDLLLPSGFTPSTTCNTTLGGVVPVKAVLLGDPDTTRTWSLSWKLPLNNDSLCKTFCFDFGCVGTLECQDPKDFFPNVQITVEPDCEPGCFVPVFSHAFWTPDQQTSAQCAVGACDTVLIALHGTVACIELEDDGPGTITGDTILPPTPQSHYNWDFTAKRLNIGLPDNDDDRSPDAPVGTANASGVRRDRFLPGDTLRVAYQFVVDSGGGYRHNIRSIFHEIVGSDLLDGSAGNDVIILPPARFVFADQNNFQLLKDSMRIRYADGSQYTCAVGNQVNIKEKKYFQIYKVNAFPPEIIDDVVTIRYAFKTDLDSLFLKGCLPKATLDKGDSLFFYTDFKLNFNYRPISANNPDPPLIGFRTALSHNLDTFAYNKYKFYKQQYSGFREKRDGNQFGVKPCENSTEIKPFRYTIRLARPNLFPYEVRPLSQIVDYRQYVPQGLSVNKIEADSLTLQNQVTKLENISLPYSIQGTNMKVDFSPVYAQAIDEGYSLRTNMSFLPLCEFPDPDSGRQIIKFRYEGCLKEPNVGIDSIKQSIGYFSNQPKLAVESADTVTFPANANFELSLKLRNQRATQSINSWMAVVDANGASSDFSLILMPQNQVISAQNGVFPLGTINGFSAKNFVLRGKNSACNPDSLLVIFGWNCTPLSSLNDPSCGRDSFYFVLEQQSPELELDPLSEDTLLKICEASDYYEFEVLNGKSGTAYDLLSSVKLPLGAIITPGSAQISYPSGSAWQALADPISGSGNLFTWDLASLIPQIGQQGLPGFDHAPQNKLKIRFKISPGCGFVANSPLLYQLSGVEPCGQPSNMLIKPGQALQVEGISVPYGVSISLQPTSAALPSCGKEQEFEISMNLLGTPSAQDSVYVLFPAGLTYLTGSYVPGINAPAGAPVKTSEGIRVALPTQLAGGGPMKFKFKALIGANAGCEDVTLLAQTRVKNPVFCSTAGGNCDVYLSTGESSYNIHLEHPQFSLISSSLYVDNAQLPATFSIQNTGNIGVNGLSLELWQDNNHNQQKDAGDSFLQELSIPDFLAAGANLHATLPVGVDLCNVLLVFPAAKNCLCEDLVFPIEELSVKHNNLALCDLSPINVGVTQQSEFTYSWSGNGAFACGTCAETSFTPPANTPPGTTLVLFLEEKSASCTRKHEFKLVYGNVASILVGNNSVCEGKTTILNAQPAGANYHWEGPGIGNPALQQQNIKPNASATYALTVSFSNGCSATAQTQITVLPADTLLLAPMHTCAGESVTILGNQTSTAGMYSLKLTKKNGCDSLLRQELIVLPKPYKEEKRSFCPGDTLFVMDTLFTSPGQICRKYQAANGCDSTFCLKASLWPATDLPEPDTIKGMIGDLLQVQAQTGYSQYHWTPTPFFCNNCNSFTLKYDSSGLYQYFLTVTDANGCRDSATYRILILPPCDPKNVLIPNVFTPDGDGTNDYFQAYSPEKSEVFGVLTIYDRWGEKVYEDSDRLGWDGRIKGEPAPVDVYIYRIVVQCSDGEHVFWGDVSLLR